MYTHKAKVPHDKLRTRQNLADMSERFEVIRGEIVAGNDNPRLLKQLGEVIEQMRQLDMISKTQYTSIKNYYL
jgi:hypothetical protein